MLTACSSVKTPEKTVSLEEKLERIAKEKYGDNYALLPNRQNSHSLVIHRTKRFLDLGVDINFFVFDHQKQEMIFEDALISGKVEWISESILEANSRVPDPATKGKILKETYRYNVTFGTKIDL